MVVRDRALCYDVAPGYREHSENDGRAERGRRGPLELKCMTGLTSRQVDKKEIRCMNERANEIGSERAAERS